MGLLGDPRQAGLAEGKVIRFDEIDAHFPKDVPRLTPAERREAIKIRQEHVKRRFRVF